VESILESIPFVCVISSFSFVSFFFFWMKCIYYGVYWWKKFILKRFHWFHIYTIIYKKDDRVFIWYAIKLIYDKKTFWTHTLGMWDRKLCELASSIKNLKTSNKSVIFLHFWYRHTLCWHLPQYLCLYVIHHVFEVYFENLSSWFSL
jgi:hypothetical protein